MGEMVMEIRRELVEIGRGIEKEREGIMMGRVKHGKERWRIVGVYLSGDMERALQGLERWMEDSEEGVMTLIGGILMREQERRQEGLREGKRRKEMWEVVEDNRKMGK